MPRATTLLSTLGLATALAASSTFLSSAHAAGRGPVTTKSTVHQIECEWDIEGSDDGLSLGTSYVLGEDTPQLEARLNTVEGITERGYEPFTWGSSIAATVQLTTPDRTPTSTLTIRAERGEGETTVEQIDERDGNLHTTGTVTTTEYPVRIDEVRYSSGGLRPGRCGATVIVFDTTSNNPQYHRTHSHEFESEPCTLQGMGTSEIWVHGDYARPSSQLRVHRGSAVFRGDRQLRRSASTATARTELRDLETDELGGTARTTVTFVRAGRPTLSREVDGPTTTVTRRVPTTMKIDVRTSAGEVGRVSCAAVETEVWTTTKRW